MVFSNEYKHTWLNMQIDILHDFHAGSGRVTFSSKKSYMKAVQAAFIEIKTPKFTKKVGQLTLNK